MAKESTLYIPPLLSLVSSQQFDDGTKFLGVEILVFDGLSNEHMPEKIQAVGSETFPCQWTLECNVQSIISYET